MKGLNKSIAIVCPVYKSELNQQEMISMHRMHEVFKRFDIFYVAPKELTLEDSPIEAKRIVKFDRKYFKSTKSYNLLLMESSFYKKWTDYVYILIYQLDCYVFNDNLEYWTDKGYDFVGAPWFEGYTKANSNSKIIGVGNGGLSLRKVKSSIDISKHFQWKHLFYRDNGIGLFKALYKYVKHYVFGWNLNEDQFWCQLVPKLYPSFNVSSVEDAIKFSFESNPEVLYEMNNHELPLGCHAFGRYNSEFWRNHIPELRNM